MRIKYNAPVVLTFTLLCATIMLLSQTLLPDLNKNLFMVAGRGVFRLSFINILTLFTHICGHGDWSHLIGNFTLILVIGPMLEENYGSRELLFMMIVTALVTGLLNVFFFKNPLMGASGVVFMMILLSSFTNFSHGEIPLTFILVLILYMGVQIIDSFNNDNISQFAHIVGGLCGSFFGFFRPQKGSVK